MTKFSYADVLIWEILQAWYPSTYGILEYNKHKRTDSEYDTQLWNEFDIHNLRRTVPEFHDGFGFGEP